MIYEEIQGEIMGTVVDLKPGKTRLECTGSGRDAEQPSALCFYFNRQPTDDEMRFMHDVLKRAAMIGSWPPTERT